MAGKYQEKPHKQRALPDFSKRAINKQVAKVTAQKPYVLYPLAIGIIGGLSAILLGTTFIPALIGGGIGIAAWLLDNTLRKGKHSNEYVRKLHDILELRTKESLASLREELGEVGEYSGLDQLGRLKRKYEAFDQLLRRKLNPDELTFGRYLGMAEQLYLGGLDNLSTIANISRGLNAINADHIEKRADSLNSNAELSMTEQKELEALARRKQLMHKQQSIVTALLAQNETAMTKLDEVMATIASMKVGEGRASIDIEQAMLELEELARRTSEYEVK